MVAQYQVIDAGPIKKHEEISYTIKPAPHFGSSMRFNGLSSNRSLILL